MNEPRYPWALPGRLVLIGSLCLNLALGGYVASQLLRQPERPFTAMPPPRVLSLLAGRLPEKDADVLREAYRNKREQIVAARAVFELSVSKVLGLLAEPELYVPALRAALEDARTKRMRQNDPLVEAFFQALEKMSYQTRRDLVGRFRDQ